jgi:hypothetical protein
MVACAFRVFVNIVRGWFAVASVSGCLWSVTDGRV